MRSDGAVCDGAGGTPGERCACRRTCEIDSPYNTYEHRGLPPGPIANPGEASLRAALDPQATDYLFFVANDKGGHFFSRTLAEHNRNVARLRKLIARAESGGRRSRIEEDSAALRTS